MPSTCSAKQGAKATPTKAKCKMNAAKEAEIQPSTSVEETPYEALLCKVNKKRRCLAEEVDELNVQGVSRFP